jgi:hypothetical protein
MKVLNVIYSNQTLILEIFITHFIFFIIHIIQQGKNMVKYYKKVSVSKFTLHHAYKTKQVA